MTISSIISDSTSKDIKPFITSLLKNTINLLSNPDKINELSNKLTDDTSVHNKPSYTPFTEKQYMDMYDYVKNPSTSTEDLNHFNENDLQALLNMLIREPVSRYHNKLYFDSYFIEAFKGSQDFFSSVVLVDSTYVKDSNLKIGHNEIDKRLRSISTQ